MIRWNNFGLSNVDFNMPTYKGLYDEAIPKSTPHDSDRIRQADQTSDHEHEPKDQ